MCRDTRLYINDYRCLGVFGSVVVCLVSLCPGLRVFVASLAVDLAALCWSFRAPLVLWGRRVWTRKQMPL